MFKKAICVVISLIMVLGVFAACGKNQPEQPENKTDKISVVCTVFPQYDWVREIIGEKSDKVELTLLLDKGTDLHSYQPKADDIIKISSADLFIYVGGESDKWVADTLKAVDRNVKALNLMEALGEAAKLESDEGILEEHDHEEGESHDHDHDHEEGESHEHEHEDEYDEHIWLSLKNAVKLCNAVTDSLCDIDGENAQTYKANCSAYTEKLSALDKDFAGKAALLSSNKVFVFADRFPFRYLFDDYSLTAFAAFSGCSAESEASFSTVVSLAKKVDENGLKTVFQTENPLANIAQTVVEATKDKNQKILSLDSMQSVTAAKIAQGAKYYDIMEKNINTLKEGLEIK